MTNSIPLHYKFQGISIKGKDYTLDGEAEIQYPVYTKYANFTEQEVQVILQEVKELRERLDRIKNNINNLLK